MENEPNAQLSDEEAYKQSLEVLEMLDPEFLAMVISKEHPQTIALIVSALTHTGKAAKIVNTLPEAIQADVAYRILHMLPVPPGVYREVFRILLKEIKATEALDQSQKNAGVNSFVQMLQLADEEDASRLLSNLEKSNPTDKLFLKAKETLKGGPDRE